MPVTDITITITPKPKKPHHYDDGYGGGQKETVKSGQTILWTLAAGSPPTDVTIEFQKSPFVGGTTHPALDTAYTLKKFKKGTQFDYTVKANRILDDMDPSIMFDDGGDLLGERFGPVDDLQKITQSAQAAWQGFFDQLQTAVNAKGDPDRVLFPKGISLISVEVDAGPIKVIIKVAGSDAPSGGLTLED